jgi:ATP-binding cassette, subfamily B, bacterial
MARANTLDETLPGFWRVLRFFWPYTRRHRGLLTGSFAALLAEVILRAVEPWPLKLVFDRVIRTGHPAGSGVAALDRLDPMSLATVAAVGLVVATSLRALAAYGSTVGFALIGNRVLTEVRAHVYSHLQCLSLTFHNRARSGDLTVRVISDIGMLRDVAVTALLPFVGNVLIFLGMLGLMMWLQWKLALVALVTLPLFWLSSFRLSRRIQEVSRSQRKREGAMAATAAESMSAIRTIQALSLEGTFADAFSSHNKKSLKEGVRGSRLAASLERTVDVLIALSSAMVLWYGTRLVLGGVITPGDLIVFLAYLKNAFKPVQDFAKYTGRLAKATAAGERVMDILEREPDVRDLPGARPAPAFRGEVRFEDVTFSYEPGRIALADVDVSVPAGSRAALVGPSGHGKSTLVSLLLRLYEPQQGSVKIDGTDIRCFTLESLRSQVSIVMQDTLLFAGTIRENIAYGTSDATDEMIEEAARRANAHDFISRLPDGYDTVVGERGVTLSNGQRQRIALARAAVRSAPILILDEPTTGLDEENERAVLQAFDRLAAGRTTFFITHDLHTITRADRVLYIENGRIVESGTHEELLALGRRYASLYRLQTGATASQLERYAVPR